MSFMKKITAIKRFFNPYTYFASASLVNIDIAKLQLFDQQLPTHFQNRTDMILSVWRDHYEILRQEITNIKIMQTNLRKKFIEFEKDRILTEEYIDDKFKQAMSKKYMPLQKLENRVNKVLDKAENIEKFDAWIEQATQKIKGEEEKVMALMHNLENALNIHAKGHIQMMQNVAKDFTEGFSESTRHNNKSNVPLGFLKDKVVTDDAERKRNKAAPQK